jgi:hypothetical protein
VSEAGLLSLAIANSTKLLDLNLFSKNSKNSLHHKYSVSIFFERWQKVFARFLLDEKREKKLL